MKSLFVRLLAVGFFVSCSLWAQDGGDGGAGEDVRQAYAAMEAKLEAALAELAAVRAEVAQQKPELGQRTGELALELAQKRREVELVRMRVEDVEAELRSREQRIEALRSDQQRVGGLLEELQNQLQASLALTRSERFGEVFAALAGEGAGVDGGLAVAAEGAEGAEGDSGAADGEMRLRLGLAGLAMDQLEASGGLQRRAGQAVDERGVLVDGELVSVGGLGYFVLGQRAFHGMVGEQGRMRLSGEIEGTAAAVVRGEAQGGLPVDATGGKALMLRDGQGSWVDQVRAGGFWVWPILGLAVVATLAALVKWLQIVRLRGLGAGRMQAALEALRQGEPGRVLERFGRRKNPNAVLLCEGAELMQRGLGRERIEEHLYQRCLMLRPRLQRGLTWIALTSASAPLLGLLGTVTGMIHTFELINLFGTGNSQSLASGISEALITTKFGLVVAIPALILHALLQRKVAGIVGQMDTTCLAILNVLPQRKAAQGGGVKAGNGAVVNERDLAKGGGA